MVKKYDLNEDIHFRVTKMEKIVIERQAKKHSRTISNYLRWILFKKGE